MTALGWVLGWIWAQVGAQVGPSGFQNHQKSKSKKACNKDGHRELLNVKILGQSEAWELLNVKNKKEPTKNQLEWNEIGKAGGLGAVGEYEGDKPPQLLANYLYWIQQARHPCESKGRRIQLPSAHPPPGLGM